MEEQNPNIIIIQTLIEEFAENRTALRKMIVDIESIKDNIDKLFPEKLDYRYIRIFEEKIKTATSMLSLLLSIRQELSKSLKDEIEIRRKIDKEDEGDINLEELLNISVLASKVEGLQRKTERKIELIEKQKKEN